MICCPVKRFFFTSASPFKSYEIVIRFDDGSSRVIQQAAAPAWRSGDRVRVINGVIHANS